jgi:hypothetical protein
MGPERSKSQESRIKGRTSGDERVSRPRGSRLPSLELRCFDSSAPKASLSLDDRGTPRPRIGAREVQPMCTPPRSTTGSRSPGPRTGQSMTRRRSHDDHPARCRWIDDGGIEWLFTRTSGTLIVERVGRQGSVMIGFPDLPRSSAGQPNGESWLLVGTAEGHLLHCSVYAGGAPPDFSDVATSTPHGSRSESGGGDASGFRASRRPADGRTHGGGVR